MEGAREDFGPHSEVFALFRWTNVTIGACGSSPFWTANHLIYIILSPNLDACLLIWLFFWI